MSDSDAIREMVEAEIQRHVEDQHVDLTATEAQALIERFEAMATEHMDNRELLSHISIAVQGVPDHDLHGNIVGYHGGIQNDVIWLKERGNGFSINTRDKVTIGLIAAIPSIAILLTAVIGS
jgi:hypothetical protein